MENNNSGVLFQNRNKKEGTNQPNMVGNLIIDGKKWAISAWSKESEKAGRFLSIKVSEPYEQQQGESQTNRDFPY